MEARRIPHTNLQVINGKEKTMNYLRMQKVMGRLYLHDFFSKFDQIARQGRYLEVGPGPGYQTHLVCEKYTPEEIIGLECSTGMIRVAEQYTFEKGSAAKISFVQGAVEDTALVQSLGKFDVIYSTFSLHRWTDPLAGIENLYQALTPGGTMFIYDFCRGGLLYYICLKKGIWESVRASYRNEEIIHFLGELGIHNYLIRKKGLCLDFFIRKETSGPGLNPERRRMSIN